MIYILHIDTSGDKGITALSADGKVISEKINTEPKNQAASINLLIKAVLEEGGITLNELAALSVFGGPGSYTGLRIGLATAKAFCYTLDKPLLLLNKLDLLALQAFHSASGDYDAYAAILPARAKEYFFTIYDNKGEVITPPQHIHEDEIQQAFSSYTKILVVGSAAKLLEGAKHMAIEDEFISTQFWVAYSLSLVNKSAFSVLSSAEPYYLKEVYTHK
jgi:tRNA threonylcarbamoyladenosine biosynthesis protein TsaB